MKFAPSTKTCGQTVARKPWRTAMRAIMADNDIQGQMYTLVLLLRSETWREIWASLNLSVRTFEELSLPTDVSDATLWHACQKQEVVLITGNRNNDGEDSLQATIQTNATSTSLPVFTISEPRKVGRSA